MKLEMGTLVIDGNQEIDWQAIHHDIDILVELKRTRWQLEAEKERIGWDEEKRSLTGKCTELNSQVQSLRWRLEKCQHELAIAQIKQNDAAEHAELQKVANDETYKQFQKKNQEYNELLAVVESLQSQLSEKCKDYSQLQEEHKQQQVEMETIRAALSHQVDHLEKQTATTADFRHQANDAAIRVQQLENTNKEYEHLKKDMGDKLSQQQQEMEALQLKLDTVMNECQDYQRKLKDSEGRMLQLQTKLDSVVKNGVRSDALQDAIDRAEAAEQLRQLAEDKLGRKEKALQHAQQLADERHKMLKENERSLEEHFQEQYRMQKEHTQAMEARLKAQIGQLEGELRSARTDAIASSGDKVEISRLKAELAGLKQQVEDKDARIQGLVQQLARVPTSNLDEDAANAVVGKLVKDFASPSAQNLMPPSSRGVPPASSLPTIHEMTKPSTSHLSRDSEDSAVRAQPTHTAEPSPAHPSATAAVDAKPQAKSAPKGRRLRKTKTTVPDVNLDKENASPSLQATPSLNTGLEDSPTFGPYDAHEQSPGQPQEHSQPHKPAAPTFAAPCPPRQAEQKQNPSQQPAQSSLPAAGPSATVRAACQPATRERPVRSTAATAPVYSEQLGDDDPYGADFFVNDRQTTSQPKGHPVPSSQPFIKSKAANKPDQMANQRVVNAAALKKSTLNISQASKSALRRLSISSVATEKPGAKRKLASNASMISDFDGVGLLMGDSFKVPKIRR